jgi:hypothetical protein
MGEEKHVVLRLLRPPASPNPVRSVIPCHARAHMLCSCCVILAPQTAAQIAAAPYPGAGRRWARLGAGPSLVCKPANVTLLWRR